MKDRFDLEQEIIRCWNITDDIKEFVAREDITAEHWQALAKYYDVKFNALFETFESMTAKKKIL